VATSNKRERENERLRRARQEQRRAEAAARRRRQSLFAGGGVVVAVIIAAIVIAALNVGGSGKKSVTAGATTSATPSATSAATATPSAAKGTPVCDYIASGVSSSPKVHQLPPDTKATGTPTLTMKLTEGTVIASLDAAKAPCTVNSFEFLAQKGYFNDTICHRLTTSGIFVLQCGDPTGTGTGGPGYTIPDENLTGATYPAGTLAMANTGTAHTGGSQFFLCYKDSPLPAQYTPFGTITSGLNVLTAIAAKGSNNANGTGDGAPKEKVTIVSFTIS
jgi:peptidyl-prolyl cis-trans isomerase B (cyclophilin B)